MYYDVTGIILSGGKSSRMGVNKAFLKLGENYVIENITFLMKEMFKRVIVITNEPELYDFLDLELFEDEYSGKGPLVGIHSGLIHSRTEKNFIIACDIPLITKEIIEFIIEYPSKKRIVVPHADKYIQQLCGMYSKSCLSTIEKILKEAHNMKKCKVTELIEEAGAEIINIEKYMPGYMPNSFLNMNNITEFEEVKHLYEKTISPKVRNLI